MVTLPKSGTQTSSHPTRATVCWLFLVLVFPASAIAGDSRPSSRRHIPAKNLVAYFEFDGLNAHAAAWKGTSAYAALNKTKAGAMIRELENQVGEWLIDDNVPFVTSTDALDLQEHILSRGFTIAIHSLGTDALLEMNVLHDFKSKDLVTTRKHIKRLITFLGIPKPNRVKGRELYEFDPNDEPADGEDGAAAVSSFLGIKPANANAENEAPWLTAWFEGDDLILVWGLSEAEGDKADPRFGKTLAEINKEFIVSVIDSADGREANVVTHAAYKLACNDPHSLKGFEPAGLFFFGPGDRRGIFTPFLVVSERPDRYLAPPPPAALGHAMQASPARPPVVDDSVRKAAAEVESLPSPLTEKDLEFLKPHRNSECPKENIKLASKPQPDDADSQLPSVAEFEALGLNDLKCVAGRFGFQGEAFLTDLRLEAPAPRKGINALFDQPSFRKDRLPPIPQQATTFAIGSLDLERSYQSLIDLGSSLNPGFRDKLRVFEQIVRDETNVRFREDFLKSLGPIWCVYAAPSHPGDHKPRDKSDPTAYVLLASVKDAAAFGKVLDTATSYINENEGFLKDDQTSFLERLPAPAVGYRLTSRAVSKLGMDDGVRPTIMVGKSYIAVAATPDLARAALAVETDAVGRWKATGKMASAFERLPDDMTFLSVSDNRDSDIPKKIAELPRLAQTIINLSQEEDLHNASPWIFLDMFGLPRPDGFQVKIDRSHSPNLDDLRPYVLPSVVAATVDERGLRLISSEAFPFAMLVNEAILKFYFGFGWTIDEGLRFEENVQFTIFGLDPTDF